MSLLDIGSGSMAAGDVLNTVADTLDKMKNASKHAKTSSLVNVTSVARVEPLAIIDSDSMNTAHIGQVLQCAHNIFTGYYLQAISLLGTVGDINVIRTLDKLNPNRKPDQGGFLSHVFKGVANESYPSAFGGREHFSLSLENFQLPNYALENEEEETKEKKNDASKQMGNINDKALASATELSNLSFGKLINVTLSDNGQTLTVPISIRLIANELSQSPMLKLLSLQGLDRSWTERYWKWRAGRIGFIKDLILCQDLIREDKKAMMQDKGGLIDEIMRRARNNKLAGFFSKNASMNESANIVVFSEETAAQLKVKHNIDVDNFKQRQTIFDGSYAMILVKVDREYERVTFFINGMPLGSSMSKNELKGNSAKGSGSDLVEIFTALKKSDSSSLF